MGSGTHSLSNGALLQQVGSTAGVEGIAVLSIPWLHQSVAALLDGLGQVHVFMTPKPSGLTLSPSDLGKTLCN